VPPKEAVYVNDWRLLHKYKVRGDLERYGGAAYFDKDYKICSIYVSFLNKMILPNDELWEFAKWVWKTSLLVGITLIDHAGYIHLMESNFLVFATRESLPGNHPFRRLCDIFTFRTVYINYGIKKALLSQNMLIERTFGMPYAVIEEAAHDVHTLYQFKALHERIDESMKDVPDDVFPIQNDAKAMYDIMEYLVSGYIDIYYEDEDAFCSDPFIQKFYAKLTEKLKITDSEKQLTKSSFVHVLSGLIVSVTAYHELVGSVMDVVSQNINWIDTKIYKNKFDKLQQSKNDVALTSIVVMLTGLRQPGLVNDFTHVLIKDDKLDKLKELFTNWQNKLLALILDIDERNKKRRIAFNACNPRNLECSVSI